MTTCDLARPEDKFMASHQSTDIIYFTNCVKMLTSPYERQHAQLHHFKLPSNFDEYEAV